MQFLLKMVRSHNWRFLPYIIYIYGLGWGVRVFAQCPTPSQFGPQWVNGSFNIVGTETATQCTGRAITIITPSNVVNARYVYDFKNIADTSKATTATTFTYTQPGPYSIVQLGFINGKPSVACGTIQVYAASKPTFTLSSECGNSAQIAINTTGLAFGQYIIDWGDGRPTQVYSPGQPPLSYTYAGPGTYPIKVTGEGTLALAGCTAVSDPKTFEVLQDPLPVSNALATVKDDRFAEVGITLSNPSNIKNYTFSKNGTEVTRIKNFFTDSTSSPSQNSVCYQLSYSDICDHKPMVSPTVCTIHLKMNGEMLNWTSQSPFISPVTAYTVEKIDENGQILATYNAGIANEWLLDINDNDPTVIYRIKATTANGQISISNTFKFSRTVTLFVPDTFSPNNDQINDTFELKGQSVDTGEITVFDRWGNVLFYSNDWKKAWDGTDTTGRKISTGFYTYRINYTDLKKDSYSKLGTVYLLR